MIGRISKHMAIYSSAPRGGGAEWRPIEENDFSYTGSYTISPYGELYMTSSGTLRFNEKSSVDICIVGGGGGGGRTSPKNTNYSQSGGGGGGGGVLNVFGINVDNDIAVTVAASVAQRTDGANSSVTNNGATYYAYGGQKGVDGSQSSKKCGDGGNGGAILSATSSEQVQSGSGGGGGSYGIGQAAVAGGSNGANGNNGTTNNTNNGIQGNGGIGGGIDCHCFTEDWNTLFGSGGNGGAGASSRNGTAGTNYRGNGGDGGSTSYNSTGTYTGGAGGSGVVVVRFHCDPRPQPATLSAFSLYEG